MGKRLNKISKEEKEKYREKVMALFTCLLYDPDKISWLDLKKIALYLYGTHQIGPKNIENIALCVEKIYYQIYGLYKKEPSLTYEKNRDVTLGTILLYAKGDNRSNEYSDKNFISNKSSFIECKKIYEEILRMVPKKEIYAYLKKKADDRIKKANRVISSVPQDKRGRIFLMQNACSLLQAELKRNQVGNYNKIYKYLQELTGLVRNYKDSLEEKVSPVKKASISLVPIVEEERIKHEQKSIDWETLSLEEKNMRIDLIMKIDTMLAILEERITQVYISSSKELISDCIGGLNYYKKCVQELPVIDERDILEEIDSVDKHTARLLVRDFSVVVNCSTSYRGI